MGSAWAFHNSYRYEFFAHGIHALKFRYLGIYRNVNRFGITPFIFIASVFHEGALLFFSSVSAYQEIKRLVWLNMFSLSSPTVIVCTYVWRWYNCFPWIHFPILRSISVCLCPSFRFQFRHGWMLPREHFAQIIIAVFLASQFFVASARERECVHTSYEWNGFFRFWFFPLILFIRSFHINLLFLCKYSMHTRCCVRLCVGCGMAWPWTKHKPNYYHIFFILVQYFHSCF